MKYLIIGDGRLAKHIQHYFSLLDQPYLHWSRQSANETQLKSLLSICDYVLILITDSAIADFIQSHPELALKKLIHMSGALYIPGTIGAHPLNTFGSELYPRSVYENTPFILDDQSLSLQELFPFMRNPSFVIHPNKKAFYHSLCVMSGNFTTLLWQNVMDLMESELDLPSAVLKSYQKQVFYNLLRDPGNALTGPFSRNDWSTVIRNLDALRDLPEQKLYYAFLNYLLEKRRNKGTSHEHAHV